MLLFVEIGKAGDASYLFILGMKYLISLQKNEHLIFTEVQTPCQTCRFPRRCENQHTDERDKCSYPIENREEVRDRQEVQKKVSPKVPLRTSFGGEEQGVLRIESLR